MNQGDIVIVPFPYTDFSALKTRPALVISKNNNGQDVVLLGITSKENTYCFKIENTDLKIGELPLVSFVKISSVVAVRKVMVRKRVAVLKNKIVDRIIQKFKAQF